MKFSPFLIGQKRFCIIAFGVQLVLAAAGCSSDSLPGDMDTVPDGPPADVVTGDLELDGAMDLPVVETLDVLESCGWDQCDISGSCVENMAPMPGNVCMACIVLVSRTEWAAVDTGTCDDGDPCTQGDRCVGGKCVAVDKPCDDANPCTVDGCGEAGDCSHLPAEATCDDANICTVGDLCVDGECAAGSSALDCDDGNVCTSDVCDPAVGCSTQTNSSPCDDANPCTETDICVGGKCTGGGPVDCDDNNVCTVDFCDPKQGCVLKSLAPMCADSNPCTDEICDPKLGCVYPFNSVPCDDGSACSLGDMCINGACLGAPAVTDDGNPCTDDACDPKTGVAHVPNQLPCDDKNACTLGDACSAAKCVPGGNLLKCDDANLCTDDACLPAAGCSNLPNDDLCDDGTACTEGDICSQSKCVGAAVNCDDSNACTTDSCDPKSGCKHAVVSSHDCRPKIDVTFPPRAATLQGNSPILQVTGKVTSGAGAITSFLFGGKPVALQADGAFSIPLMAKPGGNTLVFEATDVLGSSKKRVQAFLWSSKYFKPTKEDPATGIVDPGLGYFLSQGVIDDGDHSLPPNDLATIFELYLQSMNLNALLPQPAFENDQYKVFINNLTHEPAKVTLKAQSGGLRMVATLAKPKANLNAQSKVWYAPSATGTLNMTAIVIATDVVLSVTPSHQVAAKMQNTTVDIQGISISIDGILGWLLSPIINAMTGLFVGNIEQAFQQQVAAALEPALGTAFSALAFSFAFEIPKLDGSGGKVKVDLATDAAKIDFAADGGAFFLRSRAFSTKANSFDNLGVPGRIGCGTGIQTLVIPRVAPLELAVADDAFNELLYASWIGGLFEFPVPASLLGNVDLGQYGISNLNMKVSAMLAPTMDDCNPAGALKAHIGDFRVDATMDLFGQKMDVVLFATFTAGVNIVAQQGSIGVQLTKVESVDIEVNVVQDSLVASEGVIAKLVADQLIGGIVAALGQGALGSFPLPVIDLSGTMPGLPPGTGIAIDPKNVKRVQGNSIVEGTLK
ncbi:MAG: hypothetical protein ACOYOB_00670 [Myxococcota bacterium]